MSVARECDWETKMYLDHICPDNLTFSPPRRILFTLPSPTQELMADLVLSHHRDHIEPLHVRREEIKDGFDILVLHLSKTRTSEGRCGVNLVLADHSRDGHIPGNVGEFDVYQLGNVERAVVVPNSCSKFSVRTGVCAI